MTEVIVTGVAVADLEVAEVGITEVAAIRVAQYREIPGLRHVFCYMSGTGVGREESKISSAWNKSASLRSRPSDSAVMSFHMR